MRIRAANKTALLLVEEFIIACDWLSNSSHGDDFGTRARSTPQCLGSCTRPRCRSTGSSPGRAATCRGSRRISGPTWSHELIPRIGALLVGGRTYGGDDPLEVY